MIRAKRKLDALIKDIASETFDVKQPGLRKFFDSGKGDRLVKSVEKDHSCAIQVQKNFDPRQRRDDDDDHDDRAALSRSDASTLVATKDHHRISLSDANFEAEKVRFKAKLRTHFPILVNLGWLNYQHISFG